MTRSKTTFVWGLALLTMLALLPGAAQAQRTLLRLRVDGPMLEAPSDSAGLMAIFDEQQVNTLHKWVRTLHEAGNDKNIDGLVLIVEQPLIGFAQLEELVSAIRDFQSNGKPVYAYMDYASNLSYALVAGADHITLAENSELSIVGIYAEMMFFKGLLDKIGVEPDMLHCGDYKSAHEPYTRTSPSPEAAENLNWLLDGIYGRWVELIAEGRDLPTDEVRELIDQAPLSAADALASHLVDEVSSFPAFKQMIHKEFGSDVVVLKEYDREAGPEINFDNPFAIFSLFSRVMEGVEPDADEPGIGLIYIDGMIMVGKSDDNPLTGQIVGSTSLRAAFEQAREDDNIEAVVLRVDSPGGSALASDIIWKAATRLAQEKPLIVSMGSVAASGGYYVAIPGDVIFADSATLTGSIGVVGGKFIWRELLEDKLGITTADFSRGKHAGLMNMMRRWDESERNWMETYMNETYDQFKDRVIASRGKKLKRDLDKMAGGRVFTGAQALELGLDRQDRRAKRRAEADRHAGRAGRGLPHLPDSAADRGGADPIDAERADGSG